MSERHRAFPPAADARTRVLVLGSLPGAASLRAGQYYAHPQNAFWRLIGPVAGRDDLAALPYPDRLAVLADARLGLWDVVATAARTGSLDAAMPPAARRPPRAGPPRPALVEPGLRRHALRGKAGALVGARALPRRRQPGLSQRRFGGRAASRRGAAQLPVSERIWLFATARNSAILARIVASSARASRSPASLWKTSCSLESEKSALTTSIA